MAGPQVDAGVPYDPDGTSETSAETSPWLDLAPSRVLSLRSDHAVKPDRRLVSLLTLGGIYGAFVTWTYFAWYRESSHPFRTGGDGTWKLWRDEGWFSSKRYAAGSDKMGHAWATMALGRAGTELLNQWGGFGRVSSAVIGTALSQTLFLGVEIKDGYVYRFSYGDFTFNTLGALLALGQSMSPRFDELVDFRVQYWPSKAYQRQLEGGNVNIAEDYSGETYLLALHLGGIHQLRDMKYGGWSRFVDLTLGFETRGYKPDPPYKVDPSDPLKQDYDKRQSTFIGLSLNAQGLFDHLLKGRSGPLRKVTHGMFEVFNLPFTNLPVVGHDVVPDGFVPDEQDP